ncbi:hypothetical protein [Micromonospora sp. NPDC000442]
MAVRLPQSYGALKKLSPSIRERPAFTKVAALDKWINSSAVDLEN